jgi:hypothetical protein
MKEGISSAPDSLAEEILERLAGLRPTRPVAEKIDGGTLVVTFRALLREAVEHYRATLPPEEMPFFVLADWETEVDAPQDVHELCLEGRVLPCARLKGVAPESLCVYARPYREYWLQYGYMRITELLHSKGVTSFAVDSVVLQPIRKFASKLALTDDFLAEICAVYAALADEASRETFLRLCKFRMSGNDSYLLLSEYPQYRHPLVDAEPGDVVCEGGVLNGLTAVDFARLVGPQGRVYAFEAEPSFAEKSRKFCRYWPNILVENLALWSGERTFYIVAIALTQHR